MKKILFILTACLLSSTLVLAQQDFTKDITTAKTQYASGKLEEAHFALLQALQEIDIRIGQEVLKLLPQQMDTLKVNAKEDNVSGTSGYVGTSIRRTYGTNRGGEITIISNSPLIGTLNAFLNTPVIGGMMTDGNTKIIRVQGYKGRMEKSQNNDGSLNYTVDIPMGNSLVTYKMNNTTDTQVLKLVETLPLQQIAKLIQ